MLSDLQRNTHRREVDSVSDAAPSLRNWKSRRSLNSGCRKNSWSCGR